MNFIINPLIEGIPTRLFVDRVFAGEHFEQFMVKGRNRSILLQTNRKLFRLKGLKHRKGQWKIVEGEMKNAYILEKITDAIDNYLDNQ
jgi:hypothetical protein